MHIAKKFLLLMLVGLLCSSALFAQNQDPPPNNNNEDSRSAPEGDAASIASTDVYIPRYEAGQAGVTFGIGVIVPLFFQKFNGEYRAASNLSVGGNVWFQADIYVWKGLSVGIELGGMFALSPNLRPLFMAPITVHAQYTFQIYPIEIPVGIGIGMNIASLQRNLKLDFILKPKVGITYRINQNWSAGLFLSYWFIVQSYEYTLGNEYSRLGNFLDISAGFSYVF